MGAIDTVKQLLYIILALLCIFGISHASFAQSHSPAAVTDAGGKLYSYVNNIDKFNRLFPQEKVYLYFDNTGYYRGETIWFSAYVLRTDNMCYTDMSSVLYVELLNPSGDVIETRKLKIEDGRADGSIKLDNLFTSGFYEVRAYTRYMLNWDSRGIFSRVLPIFNAPPKEGDYSRAVIDTYSHRKRLPDNRETDTIEHDKRLNVRFFPEGGRLVRGLESVVAFEVTVRGDESFDADGYLRYVNGDTIGVSTLREGRGKFSYTPSEYSATLVMRDVKGKEHEFPLPLADDSGCVLRVNTVDDDNIEVYVSRTSDYTGSLGLVLMNNGNVEAFEIIDEDKATTGLSISKKDMSDGVSVLSLINSVGDVVAERCVFLFPRSSVDSISLKPLTDEITPCGRVKLEAKTLPNTTFSFSVRDYLTDRNGLDMNAATWLLLSSELKGYIRNAEYYLESDDDEHRKASDLLMLIQGWSRYDIRQMVGNKEFLKSHPIEDGLLVDGRLRQMSKRNTVDGVDVRITLYNKLGQSLSATTRTDKDGNYAFIMPDSEGEYTMLLNTGKNGEDANYYIGINRGFSPLGRYLSRYETSRITSDILPLNLSVSEDFDNMIPDIVGGIDTRNRLLSEVTVRGRRRYENARAAWESERRGAFRAVVKYDCVKELDKILDKGEEPSQFFDWLKSRNTFFEGNSSEMINAIFDSEWLNDKPLSEIDKMNYMRPILSGKGMLRENGRINHQILLYSQGLSYKNRPIVWILNNRYYYTSRVPSSILHRHFHSYSDISAEQMPLDLKDFKSVFISEDENIWRRYITIDKLERSTPVTVFLYTFHETSVKAENGRRTHFDGYSQKTTYEMPDYSVLPPMIDYRRTLYWNPSVKTDKDGRAEIEFYNNSSCRQIVVSAEGITKDGKAVLFK